MLRRLTTLLLSLVLLFTMVPAAFAAEESTDYEMEQYFILTNAGTVYFDTAANRDDRGVVVKVKTNFDTGGQDVYIWSQG